MAYDLTQLKNNLAQVEEYLGGELRSIQTGRASPQVLDFVAIEQYGTRTPLAHVGSISIEDPRTLRVTPWDKAVIRDIEKAINDADLGLSVSSDEAGLRVHFPMLTTETRQKMTKILKERLEDARVKVRSHREDANKNIDAASKEGEFGEDDRKQYRDEVQKLVDNCNDTLAELYSKKEQEVLGE